MHYRPDLMNIEDVTDGAPEEPEPDEPRLCGECGGTISWTCAAGDPDDPSKGACQCERCGLIYRA